MKKVTTYIPHFLKYQKGCGLTENTRKRGRYYLQRFARWLGEVDIRNIDYSIILNYIEYLRGLKNNRGKYLCPSSIATELSTHKEFYTYLYKSEYIFKNPMENIKVKQKGSRKERKIFSEKDISLFLDSIGIRTPHEQRDRALFELMYSSALRVGEIIDLTIENTNLDDRVCFLKRKGGQEGFIPFSLAALKFLRIYIGNGRKKHLRYVRNSDVKNILFLNRRGKLTWKALKGRFRKYLQRCGLENKGYTHHSIRHATATHLLSHGASIRYVQELLGHESIKTTEIYTRPTVENIKTVYRTYHPRENEYFKEIDSEYVAECEKMKKQIIRKRKEYARKKRRALKRKDLKK
jgi:site-specific recombinase XerD